ncbi:hypothetical protein ACOMHN_037050 [Nucella lapillus]
MHCSCPRDVRPASRAEEVSLPAVVKLEFGSSAVAVKHVTSHVEIEQHVIHVQNTLVDEQDHPGIGLGHGRCLMLMPRLQGTSTAWIWCCTRGTCWPPSCPTTAPPACPSAWRRPPSCPSLLLPEQKQQAISAAATCCRALGLHTGVFNVELMMTPCGPRPVEINARMGGFYLRDWIRLTYNVDLFHLALMTACGGIRPVVPGSSSLEEIHTDWDKDHLVTDKVKDGVDPGKGYIMGIRLFPSRHSQALATKASPQHLSLLHQKGHVVFSQFEPEVQYPSHTGFEEPYGNLAVRASSVPKARTKLIDVCTGLGLETEESMQELLSDFVDVS